MSWKALNDRLGGTALLPAVLAPSGDLAAGGTPAALTLVANTAYFSRFTVPRPIEVTSMRYFLQTADAANPNVDVGIYRADATVLTRLASSGAVAGKLNTGTVIDVPFTAAVLLDPNATYAAAVSSNSAGVAAISGMSFLNANYGYLVSGPGGEMPYSQGRLSAASHPLPATLALGGTGPSNPVPWVAVMEV